MISKGFTFTGVKQMQSELDNYGKVFLNRILRATDEVSAEVVAYAKENHPYNNRTGKLEASVHATKARMLKSGIIKSRVIAGTGGAYYARYVEAMVDYWVIDGAMLEYRVKGLEMIRNKMNSYYK